MSEVAVRARWAALVAQPVAQPERRCVECGTALPAQEGPGRPRVRCGSVECARAFRRRRGRAYYEANKDEIAEKQRAYYEANKDEIAEKQRAYREANKDEIAEKQRAYREANKPTGPLVRVCVSCGQEFTQPRRQAHPFMRCEPCRTIRRDRP